MTREYKISFFTFLFSLLFFLPHAAHGRLAVHHVHRSPLPHYQLIHRQSDINNALGDLGNILSSGQNSQDSGGTSSSSPSTNDSPATTAPTATTTSSDPLNAVTGLLPGSGLLPSSSSSPLPQTTDPPSSFSSTPTPTPTTSSPQSSSPSTSSPTSAACPLGLNLLGQCILPSASSTDVPSSSASSSQSQTPISSTSSSGTPSLALPLVSDVLSSVVSDILPTSTPTSSNTPASSAPTSSGTPFLPQVSGIVPSIASDILPTSTPTSSNTPASPAPTSSGTPFLPQVSGIVPSIASDILPTSTPTSSDTPASSAPTSSGTPFLPQVSGIVPSIASDILPTSTPASSNTPASSAPTSYGIPNFLPTPSASSPLASLTNLPSPSTYPSPDNRPSLPSPAQSSSAPIDPCGSLGLLLGLCATSGTPTSASVPSSGPFPTSQLPSPSAIQSGISSIPGSPSQFASDTAAESSSGSLTPSTSRPVISFPSYTTGQNDQTTGVQSTFSGPSAPVFTPNSQFSYVTVTSLLGASFPSSSIPPTQTNPDAATTTLSLPGPSNSAAGPVASAVLPANLPARIYPPDLVSTSDLPSDDVLCSILFTNFLNWEFVVEHSQSQGQLFSWTPLIISEALNISSQDTPPFALQVFVPDTYTGPVDASLLLTEYLFYLKSSLVPDLANQIRVLSSQFYNISEPYRDLAEQVDAAFALTSVSNPNAVPGATSATPSRGNKSRTGTIIGVVSALGGLALIILGILIFNSVKRSRELRHQRLSDPNLPNDPYPDRTGRDFDQDSVGGPRRRSFYFAEDSLRGQPQTAEQSIVPMPQAQTQYVVQPGSQIQYISRSSPENMRERRAPVVPGTISAPILTQSSLNW